jgi:hypothetical protein
MRLTLALGLLVLAACDEHGGDAPPDAFPDATPELPDAMVGDPETLADTGLYSDPDNQVLAPGVVEYTVNWELWADGASKRRFVKLPEGETIDSSDMDFWTMPVGTRIWKEFSVGEVRVETRLLWKRGPALEDWFAIAFAWNQEGTEALAVPEGADDVLGTSHDIPRDNDCGRCHERQPDFVLGFSALQLAHADGAMNLGALVEAGALSDPPPGETPFFALPGDQTARDALGLLHGNCGGCHHGRSDILEQTPLQLRLTVATLGSVQDTPAFTTAVDQPEAKPLGGEVTAIIASGNHVASAVWARMGIRGEMTGMPPLASEEPDEDGRAAVASWIDSL